MKKRIEDYILNEPWEDRFERMADQFERLAIRPFLFFAAIYVLYMVLAGFMRG